MNTELRGTHRTTFDAVFQHPIARNLTWRDVRAMIDALGDSKQSEHERTLKVTRNGHTLVLHRPFRQTMTDVRELMNLRRFLEQSVAPTPLPAAAAHGEQQGTHLLVVIDHRMARVYKSELHGSLPTRVIPYDRGGFGRHLHHVGGDSEDGQRKPEIDSFYEAVARTLVDAEQVLLFGNGTGASSAMEQLVAAMDLHHGDLARRVVGTVVVDESHMTEGELLARAREFYARIPSSNPTGPLSC